MCACMYVCLISRNSDTLSPMTTVLRRPHDMVWCALFSFVCWHLSYCKGICGGTQSKEIAVASQRQFKSNQITFIVTSPQHKCLGEWNSYERAPDSAEKQQTIYIWTDSAKKQQTIYIWTDSAKKLHWSIYSAPDSAKKQQQFTYGQTVQKNNSNLHMDSTYLQTVQKTMCKIHIHVLSTLSVL